ncbi:NACHT domain-containing protein [Streptomyces sp. NBC_00490]|uniref:NACHT domain-containing protein n=1 Tax=Streptomyces sp. NBC_00490 TaxID=2903657 RepID=UPI002E16D741
MAWYITRGHQLWDPATVVSAFTGLLALPAAVIAVLHLGKREQALAPLEELADQLAPVVRQQWEAEAQVRRLNDPFPLPVAWEAADAELVEAWPHLNELAQTWAGQPSTGSLWAACPTELAGQGVEIAQVFERVPTRRLVIIGEPGTGKTMLLIRFLLALLDHRQPGGPLPVLFPLASWDPAHQDLFPWMADQLARDHPALRTPAPASPPGHSPWTQARSLLEQRLILPVLDGLDELPDAVRSQALDAINRVLPAGQPLVLSSRTDEYRHALTPPAGTSILLNGAAGIRLLPLDAAKAAAYLERDAGGSGTAAAARWSRVTASLGTGSPAAQALSTPLGLFLARTIYNPRPDENLAGLGHPDELLDEACFPTREDIDTHLFAAFIASAYRPHPHGPPSPLYSAQQAEGTLTLLAGHLQHGLNGTPNLAWWHLRTALPRRRSAFAVGLTAGLAAWCAFEFSFGFGFGLANVLGFGPIYMAGGGDRVGLTIGFTRTGFWFGLLFGLPCAVVAACITLFRRDRNPSAGLRWSWRGTSWLVTGLTAGLAFGLLFGLTAGLANGLAVGLAAGLAGGLMGGLRSLPPDLDKAVGPYAVLARDRRTFLTTTLTSGLTGALALGLVLDLLNGGNKMGLAVAVTFGLPFGLASGLVVGLILGLTRSVWLEFLVARVALALSGRVPWRLMSFLADAHEQRGVLRQVGAVYQFRHLELQRHLAERQA